MTPCLKKPNRQAAHTQTQDEYKLNICSAQVCPLSEFIPSGPEAMTPPLGTTRSRSTRDRIIVSVGCHREPMNLHCGNYKVGGQGRVCKEFAGQKMRKEIRRCKEDHKDQKKQEDQRKESQRASSGHRIPRRVVCRLQTYITVFHDMRCADCRHAPPYSMMCAVQTINTHHLTASSYNQVALACFYRGSSQMLLGEAE